MDGQIALYIQVGVTVVLVAALVATVLNLMTMGQSIMGSGQNRLQAGISQVTEKQFEMYNNQPMRGTLVKAALQQFQGETIAILVQTTATGKASATKYYNYGALLDKATTSGTTSTVSSALNREAGQPYYLEELELVNGVPQTNYDIKGITATGNEQYILDNGLFHSELIKDITGATVGIAFTQRD